MLLVKTYLKESGISGAGMGCYSQEFIPEGTIIWEFNPLIDRAYLKSQVDTFTHSEKEFINTYAYMHNGIYYLCIDNGRFFNHSDNPNTVEWPNTNSQKTLASRDIQAGEEIVSDYRFFGLTQEDLAHNFKSY